MKRIFLTTLTAGALASSAFAQTIITGEADYVGDFTSNGAAIANGDFGGNTADRNPLFSDIDTEAGAGGWTSFVGPAWSINAGNEAERTGGDGSRSNGLAIVFDDPGQSGAFDLTFDFVLGNDTPNDSQGWIFVGISDISTAGFTSNGFRSMSDSSASSPVTDFLTGGVTVLGSELSGQGSNNQGLLGGNASGAYSTSVTLDSASYTHYSFVFFGSQSSGDTTGEVAQLDNVAVTIPEPSTALLLMGALGLGMVMMRRRRA